MMEVVGGNAAMTSYSEFGLRSIKRLKGDPENREVSQRNWKGLATDVVSRFRACESDCLD
jgi:hypothetical protein